MAFHVLACLKNTYKKLLNVFSCNFHDYFNFKILIKELGLSIKSKMKIIRNKSFEHFDFLPCVITRYTLTYIWAYA